MVHEPDTFPISTFTNQLMDDLIGQANTRDLEHQREINLVHDNTMLVTKTPWLRYTRWDKKFAGEDMNDLHVLTDAPVETATTEKIIWSAVGKSLERCWNGYHDCLEREWDLIPFWLRSVTLEKEDTKPFRSYIAPYTLTRYIGYWQSYILFCYRMFLAKDPRVEFTLSQLQTLRSVQGVIDFDGEDQAEELEMLLFKLSVSLICHSDYAEQASSLIYYSGVRGFNADYNQWRKPQDYTTILAGIQFCIRVFMLEHALPTGRRDQFTESSSVTPVMQFRAVRKWLIDGGGKSRQCGRGNCRYTVWTDPPYAELWDRS